MTCRIALTILFAAFGCAAGTGQVTRFPVESDGGSVYFPRLSLSKDEWKHNFASGFYAQHLRNMNEPSLLTRTGSHAYRFLWLRSFHRPIVVRLEIGAGDDGVLIVKVSDYLGGLESGALIQSSSIELDRETVQAFLREIETADFWKLDGRDTSEGRHGAQWVLEGVRDGEYHVVDRWSPATGAFRDVCYRLIELSGVKIKEVY